jgi:hypothetical protein
MNLLYYLAEANIYLGVFYLAYCIFLAKETYYTINRVYLLCSSVVAFILPLIQLDFLKPAIPAATDIAYTPVVVNSFTWQDGILYSYITGVVIFVIQFAIKLYQLQKLAHSKPANTDNGLKVIYLEGSNAAFSFFNYLFIGTDAIQPDLITRHELVHIRQKHSADVLFLEVLKIINWFNPAVYFLQNSIKTVHEYIADEQTSLIETDPTTYSTFLVNNAYGISGPAFTHSFFNYNLLKKRIIMLHQKRSGSLARLKYLIAVPLCAGLLCESTLGFSKTYGIINIGNNIVPIVTDTVPKKLPPPPPPAPPIKGKVEKVTHIAATKNHPAVTVTDVKLAPPPPPAPPVVKQVKFPPPVVRKDKQVKSADQVKFPPPVVRQVKFPPPVVRMDKKVKSANQIKFPPPVVKKDTL